MNMRRYTVTVHEHEPREVQGDPGQVGIEVDVPIERLRVTVDAPGALDLTGVLAAIQKTKRVYAKRTPKEATP